jgi:hypothetical protein
VGFSARILCASDDGVATRTASFADRARAIARTAASWLRTTLGLFFRAKVQLDFMA